MKIVIAVFFCLLFAVNIFTQTVENETKAVEVKVEEIVLFKDDGKGAAGDEGYLFLTTSKPVHCQILLDGEKAVNVRMEMVAVEVKGMKAGAKTVTLSYKTNGNQNVVNFKFSPQTVWNAGKYTINILLDGKPAASREFEIESPAPAAKEK